jgi:hypothetical protein
MPTFATAKHPSDYPRTCVRKYKFDTLIRRTGPLWMFGKVIALLGLRGLASSTGNS